MRKTAPSQPTEVELQILRILWDLGPSPVREIHARLNADKGLAKVSNEKLIKLHDVLADAKQRFGSRDKLISAILELKKRTKDANYSAGLKKFALPQLLDLHASVERANKRLAAKAAAPAKAAKKAPAPKKAPAAKKTAAKK